MKGYQQGEYMRPATIKTFLGIVVVAMTMTFGSRATAGKLDLTLANFIECPPNDDGANCKALQQDYETFLSEYLFGIAPKVLTPAETLGYAGFYMGLDASFAFRPTGGVTEKRWQRGTASDEIQTVMFNPGVHIRKGFPHFFGQPWSIELGSRVSYLALSELVTLGGDIKLSFFEGYHSGWRGALPDIAATGSVVRVVGESDADITIVAVNATLSYSLGVAGIINLAPYAGYQVTMSIINVEPLLYYDGQDYHEQTTITGDGPSVDYWETTALGSPFLVRHNAFFGLRMIYELLDVTLELDWGLPRKWETDEGKLTARVGHQIKLSTGIGVNF
jgi:hypothetical protein